MPAPLYCFCLPLLHPTVKCFLTHFRGELDAKESSHSHGRKPLPVRVGAVKAAAKADTDGEVDWALAVAIFKKIEGGIYGHAVSSHHADFLKHCWHRFTTTGSVADAPRSGRPPLIPDEEAARAAELVKQGRWVWRQPKSQGVREQVLFRSIAQAIRELPELATLCHQYGVTSSQLRCAMERADPDLTLHTLHLKYAHSAEQLEERQGFCLGKLAALPESPSQRMALLDSMVWCDEGGVAISALEQRSVRVWGSKAAKPSCDVLHLPAAKGQKDCKLHFFIAVSSHPAYRGSNGLVYFEFTTGTSAMRRLHNTLDQDEDEAYEYQVSHLPFTDCVAKCIITHMAVHVYRLYEIQPLRACFHPIAMGKHHTWLSCCNCNCCKHHLWLLHVAFMHPHQSDM